METQTPAPPETSGVGLRHEVRRTLLLATPLVIGQLTSFGMNFVDTIMAGRLGTWVAITGRFDGPVASFSAGSVPCPSGLPDRTVSPAR